MFFYQKIYIHVTKFCDKRTSMHVHIYMNFNKLRVLIILPNSVTTEQIAYMTN